MKDTVYLIFSSAGVHKMTKNLPALHSGEYAVCLNMEVPDAYFKAAIPKAQLTLGEEQMITPPVTLDVQSAKDAMAEQPKKKRKRDD